MPQAEPETPASLDVPASSAPVAGFVLAPGELRALVGTNASARPLPFGSERSLVSLVLYNTEGEARARSNNSECPSGPLSSESYENGLTVYFRDGTFVGWFADETSPLTTMTGVGPGTTFAEFSESFAGAELQETSLGWEAASEDVGALFDGPEDDAKMTAFWSGDACIFR